MRKINLCNLLTFRELPPIKIISYLERHFFSAFFAFFEVVFSIFQYGNEKKFSGNGKNFLPEILKSKPDGKRHYLEKCSPGPENCRKVRGEDTKMILQYIGTMAGSITTSIEMDVYGIYDQLYEKYPCVEMVRTIESSFSGFGTRVVYTIYYGYYNENGNCFYE